MIDAAIIRRAAVGDEVALAALNTFVQEIHAKAKPLVFKESRSKEVGDWFRTLLGRPNVAIWIAEHAGAPVGYLLALLQEREEHAFCFARRWYEIDQIAVDPGWRGRGIGRALLNSVVQAADGQGVPEIELNTWSFNEDAQTIFGKWGFERRSIRFALSVSTAPIAQP
jgi:GNAT superfamily N-acetyltransferase